MWKWLWVLVPMMLACAGTGEPEPPAASPSPNAGKRKQDEAPTCCETVEGVTGKTMWTSASAAQCASEKGKMVQKSECEPVCCAIYSGEVGPTYEMHPKGSCRWYYLGWNGRPAELSLCQ
jgi:hypothetical protein